MHRSAIYMPKEHPSAVAREARFKFEFGVFRRGRRKTPNSEPSWSRPFTGVCGKFFATGNKQENGMDTELLKGTLSLLILSLLRRKPMYGYEIVKTVREDTDGALEWKEGGGVTTISPRRARQPWPKRRTRGPCCLAPWRAF